MSIARAVSVVGSLHALLRNKLGLNVAEPLGEQELSCVVAPDRRLVVLEHEPIAGFERDHGTVANEAAMLALHTYGSTTLIVSPTFVAPGDSVLRTDDPGWRWHCISGHGTTLADWERRPLEAALNSKAPLASPELTGTPTAPTPTAGDNSTKLATTAFVASAIAAGQTGWVVDEDGPQPAEANYAWTVNGDTEGVIYAVGTAFGTQAWANPAVRTFATAGKVGVMSSANNTNETTITDHAWISDSDIAPSGEGAWFAVDLGDYVLRPDGYTIAASNYHALRSWKVQGTNAIATWDVSGIAAASWTDLDVQTNNTTLTPSSVSWCHVAMTQPATSYRYLRIVEVATSSGQHYLCMLELELYGALLRPAPLPANALGWLTDGADHFVPYY